MGLRFQEPTPLPAGPAHTVADPLASAILVGALPCHPTMGYMAAVWIGKDPDFGTALSKTEGSYWYYPAMPMQAAELLSLLETLD